ncbi:beta-lactamase family protein [Verrucomicrobia bacterium]|nr:beta-lactamase family protein [Verrucomicrobiota bacterium]
MFSKGFRVFIRSCPFLLLFLAGCSTYQPVARLGQFPEIDRAAREEMAKQGIVGATVGIIRDNRIVYLQAYGLDDPEKSIPMDTDKLFRWASISKPLTALAAMQLWEMGDLDLDADVRLYVPEFPDKGVEITMRQLLGHQGGIVHYSNGKVIGTKREYDSPHPFEDVVHALDGFNESPLVNQPGAKYSYSTRGYILASAVVQKAGKERFADQVQRRIAEPQGMQSLQPDYQWKDIPNRALGYRKTLGVIRRSSNTDVSWKLGGGGYISTVGDLARLAEGLLNGKLVEPKTFELMSKPQKTSTGKQTSYGLGFSMAGEGEDWSVSHSGSQEKVKTLLSIYPNRGTGIVIMCNSEHASPKQFGERLTAVLHGTLSAE